METNIGQYAPVFLPGEPPSLTEKPGRPQSIGLQSFRHYRSDPVHIDARHFLPLAALPQWDLSVRWCSCLACGDPGGAKCAGTQTASAAGIMALSESFFQPLVASEGLFGQSFSIALPVQALRELPCLGSFSVVQHVRHIEGPPWLESYSVDRCIRHLKGHPEWGPTL